MDGAEKLSVEVHKAFAEKVDLQFELQNAENERQNKRLQALEENVKRIETLTISVEKMAVSIEQMTRELGKQGERLESIEKEPAEKWKKAVWIVASFVIGAVLALAAAKIGLS